MKNNFAGINRQDSRFDLDRLTLYSQFDLLQLFVHERKTHYAMLLTACRNCHLINDHMHITAYEDLDELKTLVASFNMLDRILRKIRKDHFEDFLIDIIVDDHYQITDIVSFLMYAVSQCPVIVPANFVDSLKCIPTIRYMKAHLNVLLLESENYLSQS
jgi:hypothetical protein